MSIIYLLLSLADAQAFRLIDEDDSWLDHDDPPHSYVKVICYAKQPSAAHSVTRRCGALAAF